MSLAASLPVFLTTRLQVHSCPTLTSSFLAHRRLTMGTSAVLVAVAETACVAAAGTSSSAATAETTNLTFWAVSGAIFPATLDYVWCGVLLPALPTRLAAAAFDAHAA